MNRLHLIAIVAALLFGAGVLFYFVHSAGGGETSTTPLPFAINTSTPTSSPSTSPKHFTQKPGVATRYLSDTSPYFSFSLPDGFTADDYKTNVPQVRSVVVYNQAGDGLLLFIAPTDEREGSLSAASITSDEPALTGTNLAHTTIGGVDAITFNSDNKTWSGSARELWFVRGGYRYELSTMPADAELLDFTRQTWEWR